MLRILHTNDLHGTLTPERAERLRPLREAADLYLDSGDCIKTGNLGVPLRPEPVWPLLADLGCAASCLGNRETHPIEAAFHAKLAGAAHPVLCANLRRKDGTRPLPGTLELEVQGVRVGIVAVMVPMVTERMATKAASAYLWDPPLPVAQVEAERLRPRVDLLLALTHIGDRQDLQLAQQCPLFDAILGGHSHTVRETPLMIGSTAVCQGGSHGRYAGVYEWSREAGFQGGLTPLT